MYKQVNQIRAPDFPEGRERQLLPGRMNLADNAFSSLTPILPVTSISLLAGGPFPAVIQIEGPCRVAPL